MAFLRVSGKQQLELWDEIKIAFSDQNLQTIAENEFSPIIDELSHHKIIKATTRINNESKQLIADLRDKLTKEMDHLKSLLQIKTDEVNGMRG